MYVLPGTMLSFPLQVCAAISIDPDKTQFANYPFDSIRELCVDSSVQINTREYVIEQQKSAKKSIINTYTMDSGMTESLDNIHGRFGDIFSHDPLHELTGNYNNKKTCFEQFQKS